jgi:hypothetical protein
VAEVERKGLEFVLVDGARVVGVVPGRSIKKKKTPQEG